MGVSTAWLVVCKKVRGRLLVEKHERARWRVRELAARPLLLVRPARFLTPPCRRRQLTLLVALRRLPSLAPSLLPADVGPLAVANPPGTFVVSAFAGHLVSAAQAGSDKDIGRSNTGGCTCYSVAPLEGIHRRLHQNTPDLVAPGLMSPSSFPACLAPYMPVQCSFGCNYTSLEGKLALRTDRFRKTRELHIAGLNRLLAPCIVVLASDMAIPPIHHCTSGCETTCSESAWERRMMTQAGSAVARAYWRSQGIHFEVQAGQPSDPRMVVGQPEDQMSVAVRP